MDSITFTLSDKLLMGLMLGVFGLVGWRRGVNRELLAVIGVGMAIVLSGPLSASLRPQINSMYRLSHFALHGGIGGDNMAEAWDQAKKLPELLGQDKLKLLSVLTFALISGLFYAIGQIRMGDPSSIVLRFLGFLTGMINGFLIIYYLFPIIFPTPKAIINVPSAEVQTTLTGTQTLAKLAFFFIFVLIALGLYTASGTRNRQ